MALDKRIGEWRAYVLRHPAVSHDDADELETRLRAQIGRLEGAGLDEDEAFLIAVKRLDESDIQPRSSSRTISEHLWKQLLEPPASSEMYAIGLPSKTSLNLPFGFPINAG